jgi:hypothetical protein
MRDAPNCVGKRLTIDWQPLKSTIEETIDGEMWQCSTTGNGT